MVERYSNNYGSSFSVFALNGDFVRTFRFEPTVGKPRPYRSACNQNGMFVHYGWDDSKDMKSGLSFRSQVPVWVARGDTTSGRLTTCGCATTRDRAP